MANKRKAEETYVSTRVKAIGDEFAVVGQVEGEDTEVVISTHPTVDEAIANLP